MFIGPGFGVVFWREFLEGGHDDQGLPSLSDAVSDGSRIAMFI